MDLNSALNICHTCLSLDRQLYPLTNFPPLIQLKFLPTTARMCWECGNMVLKFSNFITKTITAQRILKDVQHYDDIVCLSTLEVSKRQPLFKFEHIDDPPTHYSKETISVKEEVVRLDIENDIFHEDTEQLNITQDYGDKNVLDSEINFNMDIKTESDKDKPEITRTKKGKALLDTDNRFLEVSEDVMKKILVTELTDEEVIKRREQKRNHKFQKMRYKCDFCIVGFTTQENLNAHIKRKHRHIDYNDVNDDISTLDFSKRQPLFKFEHIDDPLTHDSEGTISVKEEVISPDIENDIFREDTEQLNNTQDDVFSKQQPLFKFDHIDYPLTHEFEETINVKEEVVSSDIENDIFHEDTEQLNITQDYVKNNTEKDLIKDENHDKNMLDSEINFKMNIKTESDKDKPEITWTKQGKTLLDTDNRFLEVSEEIMKKILVTELTDEEVMKRREQKRNHKFQKMRYKCDFCIVGFTTEENLNAHIKRKHRHIDYNDVNAPGNESTDCDICKIRFKTKYLAQKHRERHYIHYECRLCQYRAYELCVIVAHCKRNHDSKMVGQTRCNLYPEVSSTAYNYPMADQPDEPIDLADLPLPSRSNAPVETQDAAASTSATPFAEPPTIAAPKSSAQRQREYRQRIAASRTAAQLIAMRKSDTERKRNYRLRKAANLALASGSLESTTAFSSRSAGRLNDVQNGIQ